MNGKGKQTFKVLGYDSQGEKQSKIRNPRNTELNEKKKSVSALRNESWLNTVHIGKQGKQERHYK